MSFSIPHALWFGKLAVEDGFVSPEDFSEQIFLYADKRPDVSFDLFVEEAGMLTPFQRKKLNERLPSLPEALAAPLDAPTQDHPSRERYTLGEIMQQGGVGRIYKAHDKVIGREVAIKCLIDPENEEAQRRFENEYQITGRLDHPNIISVHDASESEELGPFYVMRLLEGRTLREVLRQAHERGVPGRTALLRSFLEICAAVAYAHSRGILHRDLKPSNIMVGELGEVQVMDWGIARRMVDPNLPTPPPPVIASKALLTPEDLEEPDSTRHGAVMGTPGYMAPEQARGASNLDARADIFALGVILFEMLTSRVPFVGIGLGDYMASLEQGPPPAPSEIDPSVNEELDEIVLRALALEPAKRTPTVRELSAALSVHLEGTRTQQLRQQRALSKVAEGIQARVTMQRKEAEAQTIRGELMGQQARIRPYDPLERKRPLWEKEQRIELLEKEAMVWLGEAISAFTQALALDPESQEAHGQLADLDVERLLAAEQRRDVAQLAYHEAMLQRHNDGRYDVFLQNEGSIWILSDPPGASVELFKFKEVDRILTPGQPVSLGQTPLGPVSLEAGSYLAVLTHEHFAQARLPVLVQRDKKHVYRARLYHPEDIPEGFLPIPQGRFLMGGDPLTASAGRMERPYLPDIWVATLPVTIEEYIDFLNQRDPDDPESMRSHVPRRSPDGGLYLPFGEAGWQLPEMDEDGDTWDPQWPVFAVSWYDAFAFSEWRAKVEGRPIRLPLSAELEKAARGVDGRYYPWGDRFDATFCKMGKSRPGPPKPEAVGLYEADRSVYGIQDLAGGIREWCGDTLEVADGAIAFGGNWSGSELTSRAAHRWHLQKGQVAPGIGLRLAMDAPPLPYHQGFAHTDHLPSEPIELPTTPSLHRSRPSTSLREVLADPGLWEGLAAQDDQRVLARLALAICEHDQWALIQAFDEDLPLATAGDAPESLPRELLSGSSEPEQADTTPSTAGSAYEIIPCGEPPLGALVMPAWSKLPPEDQQPLCAAIALVLQRRQERKQAEAREQKALSQAEAAQKHLTIVREAFATVAPETYLRDNYPLLDGRSAPMRRLFRLLDRLAQADSKVVRVLIHGESGVGKERVARTIHQQSVYSQGPFVAVNCGAIPENLVESELFGHVKGAFTGATRDQPGLFRQADGGTLFLDEIAELSLDAQVKLLRVLQNGAVRPVGGSTEFPFQAQVLCATHRDLKQLVQEGHFREDLYYRLVVFEVDIPALRERPEDIPVLLSRFLDDWQQESDISEAAMECFQAYHWPGNIRELENELRRALVIAEETIEPAHLSRKLRDLDGTHTKQKPQGKLKDIVAQVEQEAISHALEQAKGNKSETARVLGLSKRGLQLKMKRYGLTS